MKTKPPPTCRKFKSSSDEIAYLYDKMLYWFYQREDPGKSLPFARRLELLLNNTPESDESIRGQECRSLIFELRGNLLKAIEHRKNEIRLIQRLHEITLDTPSKDFVFRAYDFTDLSDRLDLLAILYHDSGDLDQAIETLRESKRICQKHKIPFDGQDLLEGYLDEKKKASPRNGRGSLRSKSVG